MFSFKEYDWKRYNFMLLIIMVILGVFGAYFVKFAITATNGSEYAGSYFKRQIIALFFGLCVAIVVSVIDYKRICDFAIIFYLIGTILVAATRLSPLGTDLETGSYRWLKLGVNFQPSEICKLTIIIMLAVFFMHVQEEMDLWRTFFKGFFIMFFPTAFILIQSDLSSSLVIVFVFAMMVYAAEISHKIVVPILVTTIPTVIGGIWFLLQPMGKAVIDKLPFIKYYQVVRIIGFLNPEKYANGTMYQQLHSVQSIASGQLIGKLIVGSSSSTKNYSWVDVCESDFIFSVVGEEMGFVGSIFIILLLASIVFLCIRTAKHCNDTMGYLIAVGISAMFMFQIFANIGVASMLLPNTGLPLPFLSNGISSLVSASIAIGIVINIGMQSGSGDRSGISFM